MHVINETAKGDKNMRNTRQKHATGRNENLNI